MLKFDFLFVGTARKERFNKIAMYLRQALANHFENKKNNKLKNSVQNEKRLNFTHCSLSYKQSLSTTYIYIYIYMYMINPLKFYT